MKLVVRERESALLAAAIHLATALATALAAMLVYDRRLGQAARGVGLRVLAPGVEL